MFPSSRSSSPERPARRRSQSPYSGRHTCKHPECGRTFSQPSQLRIHQNTHTGDKPYTCEYCPKAFGDPASCNRHEKEVHNKSGGVTYECPKCKTHIRRPVAFRQHMSQKHEMEVESPNEFRVASRPGHSRGRSSSSNFSASPSRSPTRSVPDVPPVPPLPEGLLTGYYPPDGLYAFSPESSPVLEPQWTMPQPPPFPSLDSTGVFGDVFLPDLSVLSLTEPGNYWRSEYALAPGPDYSSPYGSPELGPAYALEQPLEYSLDFGFVPPQTAVAC